MSHKKVLNHRTMIQRERYFSPYFLVEANGIFLNSSFYRNKTAYILAAHLIVKIIITTQISGDSTLKRMQHKILGRITLEEIELSLKRKHEFAG